MLRELCELDGSWMGSLTMRRPQSLATSEPGIIGLHLNYWSLFTPDAYRLPYTLEQNRQHSRQNRRRHLFSFPPLRCYMAAYFMKAQFYSYALCSATVKIWHCLKLMLIVIFLLARASTVEEAQHMFWKQADFGYVKERIDEMKTHCRPKAMVSILV